MLTTSFVIESDATHRELHKALKEISIAADCEVLVQLFSSQSPNIVQSMANIILAVFPRAHLIGMSTTQVIHHGDIFSNQTLVSISQLQQTTLTSAKVLYGRDPVRDGYDLMNQLELTDDSKCIISFADRMNNESSERFKVFDQREKVVPITGGTSVPTEYGQWVLFGNQCYQNAIVAIALTDKTLFFEVGGYKQWNPIGRSFRVTKADGNFVSGIDNKPIEDLYRYYLNYGEQLDCQLLKSFPLVKEGKEDQDVYIPQVFRDGAIQFSNRLMIGDEVKFCFDHPSLTLEQVKMGAHRLNEQTPEKIFVYNCITRLRFIEHNKELQPLQGITNICGCYCMGEFWHDGSHQRVMHHSMTYLALREGDVQPHSDKQFLSAPSRGVTAPLFSLIRNAFSDIDMLNKGLEQKIQRQASLLTASYRIDTRTALPNRSVLQEHLSGIRDHEHLLTLKVTNFSQINEKYGYKVGDKLLLDLSVHFQLHINQNISVECKLYAIGVGEWAAIFSSHKDSELIQKEFDCFVDELEHVNFEPYGLPEMDYLSISLCAGLVSRRDFPGQTADDLLLRSIEARRYAYKNNLHFCNALSLVGQDEVRREQLKWLSYVSRAVLDNNVLIYSQPIFAAGTHKKVSQECLVRLEEKGEIILPGRFLPVIAGTHLYTRLSHQLISRIGEFMRERDDSFSINLSPQDLMSDHTLAHLENMVRSLNAPGRFGLEVLETEQIKDYGRMIEVCDHFRSLGAKIVVDDFGSGYSNIDEIVKLEPQIIKLDGSLIRTIDSDPKQRKITEQLVKLCHVLDAQTVAEFVHNEQVCRICEDIGVDYLQGFYLGKPERLV